jgi:hypothetical protein
MKSRGYNYFFVIWRSWFRFCARIRNVLTYTFRCCAQNLQNDTLLETDRDVFLSAWLYRTILTVSVISLCGCKAAYEENRILNTRTTGGPLFLAISPVSYIYIQYRTVTARVTSPSVPCWIMHKIRGSKLCFRHYTTKLRAERSHSLI